MRAVEVDAADLERLVELAARPPGEIGDVTGPTREILPLDPPDARFVGDLIRAHELHPRWRP